MCAKYYVCDLVCDVIGCRVWISYTGKIDVYDQIVIENQKKCGNQRNLNLNLCLKDGFRMEITAC